MSILYTYTFTTYESDGITTHAKYRVPMRGFDTEEEAWAAFTELGLYEEEGSGDYWAGYAILSSIVCDETQEESN